MILKQINLFNFRNIKKILFDFSPLLTLIIGDNSKGKTNLLESLYFIITGEGFREEKEEELISFDKEEMSVQAIFLDKEEKRLFQIKLIKKNNIFVKTFFIDKTPKRYFQYRKELLGVVLFTPEQINIITGPPSERRNYFNKQISLYDLEYKKHLNNYENALKKRNKILERYTDTNTLLEELTFWNDYLEKEARYITKKRQLYVDFLNSNQKLDSKMFSIVYEKNEFNKFRLKESFNKEKIIRKTIIGPQKDNFKILINSDDFNKDVNRFGSRSEERLAVFWLKINELKYYEILKMRPILLLDDIFSELDEKNQKIIISLINNYQTIATTTETKVEKLIKFSDNRSYHSIYL